MRSLTPQAPEALDSRNPEDEPKAEDFDSVDPCTRRSISIDAQGHKILALVSFCHGSD
jgi:hypothetical protein